MPSNQVEERAEFLGVGSVSESTTRDASSVPPTYLNRRRHFARIERARMARIVDLWDLIKPEITFLVAISSLAGFFLASGTDVDVLLLVNALIGVTLSSAGGGMLNHYMERDLDALMRRTSTRPLPDGRIPGSFALFGGMLLTLSGIVHLVLLVNVLTAVLAAATVIGYLFVYTPLKTQTKFNTIIGCIPGALPALGGWTAATGSVAPGGIALFAIIFAWQMPHFLSLAWMYRRDYARARFAMLPVVEPDGRSTGFQTLLFTTVLVILSVVPFGLGLTGFLYLLGILAAGAVFLSASLRFYRTRANGDARKVLLASVVYVPILVGLILLDQLVA